MYFFGFRVLWFTNITDSLEINFIKKGKNKNNHNPGHDGQNFARI